MNHSRWAASCSGFCRPLDLVDNGLAIVLLQNVSSSSWVFEPETGCCAHLARAIARENTGFAQRLPGPRSGYTAFMADTGDDRSVAPLVRQAAAWSWRLLVLLVTAVAVLQLMRRLGLVVVPVALALMATALRVP